MLQPFKNNNWLIDVNPYVGYRFTTRLSAGIGWNQRLIFGRQEFENLKVYGPRVYGEFSFSKGFAGRLEVEAMNSFISTIWKDPKIGQREWVWSTMTGLKKEYRVTKNLKGTVLVLYNIFDPKHKSPYNDRLNTRIGFEYRIKKKQKEKVEN